MRVESLGKATLQDAEHDNGVGGGVDGDSEPPVPLGREDVEVAEFPCAFSCGEADVDAVVLLGNRAGGLTLASALALCETRHLY